VLKSGTIAIFYSSSSYSFSYSLNLTWIEVVPVGILWTETALLFLLWFEGLFTGVYWFEFFGLVLLCAEELPSWLESLPLLGESESCLDIMSNFNLI